MIFTSLELKLIRAGRKTTHRVPRNLDRDRSGYVGKSHVAETENARRLRQEAVRRGDRPIVPGLHLHVHDASAMEHENEPVWELAFEVDLRERPRLLAEQQGQEAPEQYVASSARALRDAGEAVGEEYLKAFAKEARAKDSAERLDRAATKTLSQRVAHLEQAAERGDRAAEKELFLIRKRADSYDKKRAA